MSTPPARFGRYEILGTLGQGSFATVYRARDPLLEREVALKALLPHLAADGEDRQRFLAEARALAALRHPNIVTVYEAGEAEGRPFFAMELVEGETLAALAARSGPLPLGRVLPIIASLAAALDLVHAAGLVHRDVKDSNVLIEPSGRVVLMDFGIALATNRDRLTQVGYGMGTPESAAPEQIRGEQVGPAADIYALGVLAYQLLAGRVPFSGDIAHVLYAQAHLPPPPLHNARPDLPAAVCAAVELALAKDPLARPRTAGDLVSSIREAARGHASSSPPLRARPPGQREQRSSSGATIRTQRLQLEEPRQNGLRYADKQPSPAYRWPVIWRVSGAGSGVSDTIRLGAGLTTLTVAYRAKEAGLFRVRLVDKRGEGIASPVDLKRAGSYRGTRACAPSREDRFKVQVESGGEWTIDLAQPRTAAREDSAAVRGAGDDVRLLQLPRGQVHFLISHAVWETSPFLITLVDIPCVLVDRLVTTNGPFSGSAVRKIREAGVYALVIEAEGSWSVAVT